MCSVQHLFQSTSVCPDAFSVLFNLSLDLFETQCFSLKRDLVMHCSNLRVTDLKEWLIFWWGPWHEKMFELVVYVFTKRYLIVNAFITQLPHSCVYSPRAVTPDR